MENINSQELPSVSGSSDRFAPSVIAFRARMFEGTDVVECMTDDPICHWGFTFGDRMFCSHPSNKLIADGALYKDCPATFALP